MAQVKRITPEYFFPEVEPLATHTYGTAWPLSEDFYPLQFQLRALPAGPFRQPGRDLRSGPGSRIACGSVSDAAATDAADAAGQDLAGQTRGVGRPSSGGDQRGERVRHRRSGQAARGVKVKWMRIVQVIPQMLDNWFSRESVSQISFATDSIGRIPLGVVPVEEDGSVYCEAPVGKAIYFQLLDERGMAVHSMRSATFVHPGEHLSCQGCHEDKWTRNSRNPKSRPMALTGARRRRLSRKSSSGAIPFNYIQLVKAPVFDKKCVPCHQKHAKAPDMSYASLARNDMAFSYPGENPAAGNLGGRRFPNHAGPFWRPGLGHHEVAHHQGLPQRPGHVGRRLAAADGWIGNDRGQIAAQKAGEALWPPVDMDPSNPTGVENAYPIATSGVK